jgi:predicted nucleotidyltransferase
VRNAESFGFVGIFEKPEDILPAVARAVHCWTFCDGWNPMALPLYDAAHGIDDWEMMLELLTTLRTTLNKAP